LIENDDRVGVAQVVHTRKIPGKETKTKKKRRKSKRRRRMSRRSRRRRQRKIEHSTDRQTSLIIRF
jgi:hypothetical protein